MTTNQALTIVTNSNAKLESVAQKINKGGDYIAPAEISDIIIEPNPDVRADLAAQVTALETNTAALVEWAENN